MTNKQNQNLRFLKVITDWEYDRNDDRGMLDAAIEWIKKNLSPDEVFSRDTLKIWSSENEGYLENKYPVQEY